MEKAFPFLMLVFRPILFVLFQAIIAVALLALGNGSPWKTSQGYWVVSALFANVPTYLALRGLLRKEGVRYFDGVRFTKSLWWHDLLIAGGLFLLAGPIAMLPNTMIANALWGGPEASYHLFFRKIPLWIVCIGFVWPITQGLVELPAYFSYCMPRLERILKNGWLAWAVSSFFLAFQHVALPAIFDGRYLLWRLGMFLPFAFFVGLCLKLRPRLFPYLMIAHGLVDVPVVAMLLFVK
jgi:hypothetical protein